ncbi:DnaJ-like protein [Flavobacterium croceum DSM 17960]|uniref:DnaJ-like protein n=1 Tax=Flavobacterium croceum DSM 17960 TaxID=1121886 RepID=A0A2S4N4K1_9FLAO|nr:DnaJ domain-containing protein [Flavobacterium croceum]POS00611.1 DnaJ-like protein [Flavobacterium croceum DSM 17960]
MKNYYQILGIEFNATNEEIKLAYRKLAIKFHPDKNFGDKYFEDRFKEIQIAYDALSDNNSRKEYDKKLFEFYRERFDYKKNEPVVKPNGSYDSKNYQNTKNTNNNTDNTNKQENNNGCGNIFLLAFLFLTLWFSWKQFSKKSAGLSTNTIDYADSTLINIDSAAVVADTAAYAIIDSTDVNKNDAEYQNSENIERPATYSSLNNGDSPLVDCFGRGKYQNSAYITFQNSNETDAIVCLVNYSTNETIRNQYIKAGTDFTMRKIPSGTYFLKVYYGNDWNPEKTNFCGSKGGFNFDESFSKSDGYSDLIEIENTSSSYTTGTITLYKVANGNMNSELISESEFFK